MNNVYIISNNLDRIKIFEKYYNIFNLETDTKLNLIFDNRKHKEADFKFSIFENVYYADEVINFGKKCFSDISEDLIDSILNVYGVSIKWFVFPFIHEKLKIEKAMMIDDDTLLLKPIDHYFKYDYVCYNEKHLGQLSKKVINILYPLYDDLMDVKILNESKPPFCINSGQIIHRYNYMLLKFIKRVFHPRVLKFLEEEKKSYNIKIKTRPFGGKTWILEQNIYSLYYMWLKNNGYVCESFKSDIKIIKSKSKEILKINKLPSFVHYLPIDKSLFYKNYIKQIDNYVLKQK